MTTKSKKPVVAETTTEAETPDKMTASQVSAFLHTQPEYRSASIIEKFDSDEGVDFADQVSAVAKQAREIRSGDLKAAERVLAAQAIALDGLFANLARRAGSNMEEGYGEAAERYMKLALRAQAQCAKTIQTMGELKNPRHIAFVRQANIAQNQQVNNGESPRAINDEFQQSKLIDGDTHGLRMDARAAQTSGGTDHEMEAVGEVIRA